MVDSAGMRAKETLFPYYNDIRPQCLREELDVIVKALEEF